MNDGAQALLVGDELEKEYRSGPEVLRVLRGASVAVRAGEMVALVGASGVGKSTLLHILGALDRPSAGQVRFADEDIFARSEAGLTRCRHVEVAAPHMSGIYGKAVGLERHLEADKALLADEAVRRA